MAQCVVAAPPRVFERRCVAGTCVRGAQHQRLDAGSAQHELELCGAIGRIHVHLHDAGARAGELEVYPLGAVGRPDAHPIAGHETQPREAARCALDLLRELLPGQTNPLVKRDERQMLGEAGNFVGDELVRRSLEDRELGSANVANLRFHGGRSYHSVAGPLLRYFATGTELRPRRLFALPHQLVTLRQTSRQIILIESERAACLRQSQLCRLAAIWNPSCAL